MFRVGLIGELVTEAGHDAQLCCELLRAEVRQCLKTPGQGVEPHDFLGHPCSSSDAWAGARNVAGLTDNMTTCGREIQEEEAVWSGSLTAMTSVAWSA